MAILRTDVPSSQYRKWITVQRRYYQTYLYTDFVILTLNFFGVMLEFHFISQLRWKLQSVPSAISLELEWA